MCRGKSTCSELGNRDSWSTEAPLPPPDWIRAELALIMVAFAHAAEGDITGTIAAIDRTADGRVRDWCVEHGQVSGRIRLRSLGSPPPPQRLPVVGPRNPDRALERAVLERDQYQCRYCGLPVIPRRLFVQLGAVVGQARFPTGKGNDQRHGARLAFGAQVDHVVPYSLGGPTNAENLVTACWSCNFGKASYHIEQIGLSDPRDRMPSTVRWDGLVGLSKALRSVASG